MKKIQKLICFISTTLAISSCSESIHNNLISLNAKALEGKKMAILPPYVIYNGRNPERSPLFEKEHLEAAALQREIQGFYLSAKGRQKPWRQGVILIPNSLLREKMNGLPNTVSLEELSNAQLREMTGADILLRCKLVRTRVMSEGAAKAINAGSFILSGILSKKNVKVSGPILRGTEIEYDMDMVDLSSGKILSTYHFDPNVSDPGKNLTRKANRAMAKKGMVYVREVMPEKPSENGL